MVDPNRTRPKIETLITENNEKYNNLYSARKCFLEYLF